MSECYILYIVQLAYLLKNNLRAGFGLATTTALKNELLFFTPKTTTQGKRLNETEAN
jgi:hypothetical protein